jgi:hypothetical protein
MTVNDLPLPAAFDVELFANGAQARETWPKNTNRAYNPKQEEWREFRADKGFEDGELEYENKTIWVLDREVRSSRYRRKNGCTAAST